MNNSPEYVEEMANGVEASPDRDEQGPCEDAALLEQRIEKPFEEEQRLLERRRLTEEQSLEEERQRKLHVQQQREIERKEREQERLESERKEQRRERRQQQREHQQQLRREYKVQRQRQRELTRQLRQAELEKERELERLRFEREVQKVRDEWPHRFPHVEEKLAKWYGEEAMKGRRGPALAALSNQSVIIAEELGIRDEFVAEDVGAWIRGFRHRWFRV